MSAIDECDVRERLRKVADEALAQRIIFLGQQADVVPKCQQPLEESTGVSHTAHQHISVYEPEEHARNTPSRAGRPSVPDPVLYRRRICPRSSRSPPLLCLPTLATRSSAQSPLRPTSKWHERRWSSENQHIRDNYEEFKAIDDRRVKLARALASVPRMADIMLLLTPSPQVKRGKGGVT
jgi:hypothetical protein